jgi:hypothetical protein
MAGKMRGGPEIGMNLVKAPVQSLMISSRRSMTFILEVREGTALWERDKRKANLVRRFVLTRRMDPIVWLQLLESL